MSLVGIDVGTGGCKAGLFDRTGKLLALAYREYSIEHPSQSRAEIDAEGIWSAVRDVIAKAAAAVPDDPPKALSVSSLGESVVPIGLDGLPLGKSILYSDPRGGEEAAELENKIGRDHLVSISGTCASSSYSIGKIMWIARHMPELHAKTWKYLLFADYVLFRLGAEARSDYSLAARTMAFDIKAKTWSDKILVAAGVDALKLAYPVQSGEIIGTIKDSLAYELGLPRDLSLVAGGHDQTCAALGAGVTESRVAVDGMGTVECITPAFERPVMNKSMSDSHYACVPHVVPGLYVTYAYNLSSGGLLRWYRDVLGYEERELAAKRGIDAYDIIMQSASPGPSGLLVLPYIAGAATPHMDPSARGAIIGISTATSRADVVKGFLEGICHEIGLNLDRLKSAGIEVDELRAVGGMAKAKSFLALKADMLGKCIVSLDVGEAGCLGAAMLAGTAMGDFRDLAEAAKACVHIRDVYEPDPVRTNAYAESRAAYSRLYPSLKSLFAQSRVKEIT